MLILTAPAKTLDYETPHPKVPMSKPRFLHKTVELHDTLKTLSKKKLEPALEVSTKLAELNYNRFQNWTKSHNAKNSRPVLFTMKGDVFQQLCISEYSEQALEYLNDHLRILSGFYGSLRPFDAMQPYRLEMGLNIKHGSIGKLQNFWKPIITESLAEDIQGHGHSFILDLASKEYSDAVDLKSLPAPTVHVTFLQDRNGQIKTYGLLAKRARGMMIDFCAKNLCETLDDVKKFDVGGYKLIEEKEGDLVFLLASSFKL